MNKNVQQSSTRRKAKKRSGHRAGVRRSNFECRLCKKPFYLQCLYDNHMKKKHIKPSKFPFQCAKCLIAFEDETDLKDHLKMHEGAPTLFTCDICGEEYDNVFGYNRHRLMHESQAPYKCPTCGLEFSDYISRDKHMSGHGIYCRMCSKDYNSLEEFQAHISPVHGHEFAFEGITGSDEEAELESEDKDKSEDNGVCNKTNDTVSSRPNSCKTEPASENNSEVEDGMPSSSTWKGHLNAFSCSVCKTQCLDISVIRKHQFIHVDKNYKCSKCELVLQDINSYENHVQSCSTYLFCVHCRIQFTTLENYEEHSKEHIIKEPLSDNENIQIHANFKELWNSPYNITNFSGEAMRIYNLVRGATLNVNSHLCLKWLIEFFEFYKSAKEPFEVPLVLNVVHVHEALVRICRNPIGTVSNKECFSILLHIKEELDKFHSLYACHLIEKFLH